MSDDPRTVVELDGGPLAVEDSLGELTERIKRFSDERVNGLRAVGRCSLSSCSF